MGARGIWLGFGLVALAAVAADQSWVPEPGMTKERLAPGPGEVTIERAVQACRALFAKIGLDVPGEVPSVMRLTSRGKPSRSVLISYGVEALLAVDLQTGVAWSYDNRRRETDRATGKLPRGPLRLDSAIAAQTYGWSVMERAGMRGDCKLVDLRCISFPGGPKGPGDGYPEVDAEFQAMPFGYRIHDNYGKYNLVLDALDGAVILFEDLGVITPAYAVESHVCALKLGEAREKAEPLVKKYRVGLPWNGDPEPRPATKNSQLMFVHPNGENGGLEYDANEKTARLRLAWVLVYPQDDEIWIDAADGRVLGGSCYAQRNHLLK